MVEVVEIEPKNVPLPRDSMISVRLSDAVLEAEPLEIEDEISQLQQPESIRSSSQSRCSSRSNRSSTASSVSRSVDWDVLEKTEEQEVKDEGTDEVCNSEIQPRC